jgi:hypothetical protein
MKQKPNLQKGGLDFDTTIMLIIALISIVFVIWPAIDGPTIAFIKETFGDVAEGAVKNTISFFQTALNVLGFIALAGIAFVVFRSIKLNKTYIKDVLDIVPEPTAVPVAETRWKIIKAKAISHNPSERKVALIEADSMLDEMVKKMGYSGETLAERLKNIETSDFLTLNDAWEAHKFRNKIAHESHEVNMRDAQRIIQLYENIFKEFTYI